MVHHVYNLGYADEPDYKLLMDSLNEINASRGWSSDGEFDWSVKPMTGPEFSAQHDRFGNGRKESGLRDSQSCREMNQRLNALEEEKIPKRDDNGGEN